MVADGNCPRWWIASIAGRSTTRAMLDSGTSAPSRPVTRIAAIDSGLDAYCGSTSSTTRYWFACVKIVDTWRCPKAVYSAWSIAVIDTPVRAAASRSISR